MGFPNRPSRTDFGPTYENEYPVRNPKREMGSDIVNLLMWQLAGAGLAVPRAVVIATQAGGVVTTLSQLLAFDPNGVVAPIPWVYGLGQYTFTFADKYPDQNGNDQSLNLVGGITQVQGAAPRVTSVEMINGYSGKARFQTGGGANVDVDKFILVLW